jgi:hypothetical protein
LNAAATWASCETVGALLYTRIPARCTPDAGAAWRWHRPAPAARQSRHSRGRVAPCLGPCFPNGRSFFQTPSNFMGNMGKTGASPYCHWNHLERPARLYHYQYASRSHPRSRRPHHPRPLRVHPPGLITQHRRPPATHPEQPRATHRHHPVPCLGNPPARCAT